jgi:hypothetical protein
LRAVKAGNETPVARTSKATRDVARSASSAAAPTAQTALNPVQRTRGWARKGYTAPRGQLRKLAPPPLPPAPATSRGRRVGQTPAATPPPAPPGQVKKAAAPPPPASPGPTSKG